VNVPSKALPDALTVTCSRMIVGPTYTAGTTGPPWAGAVSLLAYASAMCLSS
jgi:hypothetical protein